MAERGRSDSHSSSTSGISDEDDPVHAAVEREVLYATDVLPGSLQGLVPSVADLAGVCRSSITVEVEDESELDRASRLSAVHALVEYQERHVLALEKLQEAMTFLGKMEPDLEIGEIFYGVPNILNLALMFASELQEALSSGGPTTVSVALKFISTVPYLRMYGEILSNNARARTVLESVLERPSVRAYLVKWAVDAGAHLADCLTRLPEHIKGYPVLFKDILDRCAAALVGREIVVKAQADAEALSRWIEERQDDSENRARVVAIDATLGHVKDLVIPARRFVSEGDACIGDTDYRYFVFNDMILLAKKSKSGKLEMKTMVMLSGLTAVAQEDGHPTVILTGNDGRKFNLTLPTFAQRDAFMQSLEVLAAVLVDVRESSVRRLSTTEFRFPEMTTIVRQNRDAGRTDTREGLPSLSSMSPSPRSPGSSGRTSPEGDRRRRGSPSPSGRNNAAHPLRSRSTETAGGLPQGQLLGSSGEIQIISTDPLPSPSTEQSDGDLLERALAQSAKAPGGDKYELVRVDGKQEVLAASCDRLVVYLTNESGLVRADAFIHTCSGFDMDPHSLMCQLSAHAAAALNGSAAPINGVPPPTSKGILNFLLFWGGLGGEYWWTSEISEARRLLVTLSVATGTPVLRTLRSFETMGAEVATRLERTPVLIEEGPAMTLETFLNLDFNDLAEQLTLLDAALFRRIRLSEFPISESDWASWDPARSPNIVRAVRHFNAVSEWTTNTILRGEDARMRADLKAQFARILYRLLGLRNFSSLVAMFLGMVPWAPGQMTSEEDLLPDDARTILTEVSTMIDMPRSFKLLRHYMNGVRAAQVPCLGLHFNDLFAQSRAPTWIVREEAPDVRLVNWRKFGAVGRILVHLRRQTDNFHMPHMHSLQRLLAASMPIGGTPTVWARETWAVEPKFRSTECLRNVRSKGVFSRKTSRGALQVVAKSESKWNIIHSCLVRPDNKEADSALQQQRNSAESRLRRMVWAKEVEIIRLQRRGEQERAVQQLREGRLKRNVTSLEEKVAAARDAAMWGGLPRAAAPLGSHRRGPSGGQRDVSHHERKMTPPSGEGSTVLVAPRVVRDVGEVEDVGATKEISMSMSSSNGELVNFIISAPHLVKAQWTDLANPQPLGRGGTAEVFRAEWKFTPVAVKVFRAVHSRDRIETIMREVNVLGTLRHPNCICCMAVSVRENDVGVVTEYMAGGDLGTVIDVKRENPVSGLTLDKLVALLTDVARGVAYLHSTPIAVHRDIKPANILLDRSQEVAKLADFGLSGGSARGYTYRYAAPEALLNDEVTPAADVYSLACVVFETLTFRRPFERYPNAEERKNNVWEHPVSASAKRAFAGLPEHLVRLLERCWRAKEARPSLDEIIRCLRDPATLAWATNASEAAPPALPAPRAAP